MVRWKQHSPSFSSEDASSFSSDQDVPPVYESRVPSDIERADLTRRILLQRMNRFPDAGPDMLPVGGARYRQEGGRLRVGFASIAPGMAANAVRRVLLYAGARGVQVQWIVVPQRPGEEELPDALLAAGFEPGEKLLLMGHVGRLDVPVNPRVVVSPIQSWQEMWEYEYGSRQSFFDDPQPLSTVVSPRARDRWREQEHGWCRYYVARIDGRIAGGCYTSLFEDIPTIMGVYTNAPYRQQGVATALLRRTISDLVRPGHEACCLFVRHGNPAENLYRELDFVPLADELAFSWTQ